MADEQVSVEVEMLPPQQSDHEKKRKLVDLEADAPETVGDVEAMPDENKDGNAEKKEENVEEEAGGESELKRARLEKIEEENDVEVAGAEPELKAPCLEKSENGSNENGHEDNGDKVVEVDEEKVDKEPESLQDNVPEDTNGQEQPQEPSAPGDIGKVVDGDVQAHRVAENEQLPGQNEIESEAAKLEGMEPSSDIYQDGDGLTVEQKPESEDQTISRKIEVSNNKVGVLIGKAGDTIRYLQYNSGAKIQIMRDAEADSQATTRPVELIGTLESIEKAERLIKDVIAEADAGGSPSLVARGFNSVQAVVGGEQVEIQVPNEKVGLIIGKGGETIKSLQTRSGARIQLVPQHLPSGDQSKERTVRVTGDKKQIEIAREMIKEVMSQNVRSSSLSGGGHSQHAYRPRGPANQHWGHRNSHPSQLMGYDYPQRGPYQSQNQHYPPAYGNYPPQGARGNYGSGWEQRPVAMQGPPQSNYYGQPQGPDYGHQNPYSQAPAQSYGQGYNEMRYDNTAPPQHPYGGPGVAQPTGYHHGGGPHAGYGPPDHYGRPAPYGVQQQPAQGQPYGQPRPGQPGENPYQAPVSSAQPYGSNVPPQQSYPYASSGSMQQTYPMYGSGPTSDGYSQPAPAATGGPVYPQQGGQPVSGYGQPGAQQPSGYAAGGPTTGYGVYPSQQGYAEQQPAANNAAYGYQPAADPAYASSAQGSTAYAAPVAAQPGYAQQAPVQPGYDQSVAQSGGYGTAAAPAGYGKSVSPQPGYAQYDSSQMYGAPR